MVRYMVQAALVTIVAALVLAGCGGDAKKSGGDGGGKVDASKGRKLFQEHCKSCHTLADAKANGNFGPNLDDLRPDPERTVAQIESGGGGMPPNLTEGKDSEILGEYIASVAGG